MADRETNEVIVLDTPEDIDFYRLAALKGALQLEMKGFRRKGRSAYMILKADYGFVGTRGQVLAKAETEIEHRINERRRVVREQSDRLSPGPRDA